MLDVAVKELLRLCLVTKHGTTDAVEKYCDFLHAAIAGGVTSVQLRAKNVAAAERKILAIAIQKITIAHQVPLIINDDVDLAVEIGATGVHLGQDDMSPLQARSILGDATIIGLSIENLAQLHYANEHYKQCIDYVAASAIFATHNKADITMLGCDGLRELKRCTDYPLIAIGGINLTNVQDVIRAGADGIAVIDAIHTADNPYIAAKQLQAEMMYANNNN